MPIKVACHCGASFSAKEQLAGQTLLCPKCSQPLTIPTPGAAASQRVATAGSITDLFDEVGLKEHQGARCPQCHGPLKPNAVLCTNCGFHLQTGEKLAGAKVFKEGERGHTEAAESLLERAATQIETDKVEMKKNESQGAPAWFYFIALSMVVAFVIAMFFVPRHVVIFIGGWVLVGLAIFIEFGVYVYVLVRAFSEEGALIGIITAIFPVYYVYTHWDEVGMLWRLSGLSGFIAMIGGAMIGASGLFEPGENEEQVWKRAQPPPAAVARDTASLSSALPKAVNPAAFVSQAV